MNKTYHNGWSEHKIKEWLENNFSSHNKYTLVDPEGYEICFYNNDTYRVVWGNWKYHTPTEVYINNKLAQQTYDN